MIAAKDLMIGDIVDVHRSECVADGGHYMEWNEYGKVVSITEDYITIKYNGREDDYGFEDVEEKDIEPIPLTSEILEKNGFKNPTLDDPELINYVFKASFEYKSPLPNVEVLRVDYYDGVEWDFYALLGERESSDCGEQYEYIIIIKYVHQLQHALRLAGIDKEIKL